MLSRTISTSFLGGRILRTHCCGPSRVSTGIRYILPMRCGTLLLRSPGHYAPHVAPTHAGTTRNKSSTVLRSVPKAHVVSPNHAVILAMSSHGLSTSCCSHCCCHQHFAPPPPPPLKASWPRTLTIQSSSLHRLLGGPRK